MPRALTLGQQLAAKAGDLHALLEILLPGTTAATARLRTQIRDFCEDPLLRTLLLLGPIGCGKSTLARVIALFRYINLLPRENQRHFLSTVRCDGPLRIEKRLLPWYEEVALTGREPEDAEAQLFGVARRAFTQVDPRMGIFEAAARGHEPGGPTDQGAKITRGVVFLDEIGDLPFTLQPKLLLVLTGVEVFRRGGEGNPDFGFSFHGTTIVATWWPDPATRVRGDVLSRLSDYRIDVPSLEERAADFAALVPHVIADIDREREEEVKRLLELTPTDRAKLTRLEQRPLKITDADIELLSRHPWSGCGELRALRQVLQHVSRGVALQEALERQLPIVPKLDAEPTLDELVEGVLSLLKPVAGGAAGFAEHIREAQRLLRARIAERLSRDPDQLDRIARKIGMDPARLREQLGDLKRVRKAERGTT